MIILCLCQMLIKLILVKDELNYMVVKSKDYVLLEDPAILILDEATSALDNTTEMLIQKSLDELCKGRTTIVVAHRLSTIKNADEIAVISSGKVLEKGTHKELMDLNGQYARLYNEQF